MSRSFTRAQQKRAKGIAKEAVKAADRALATLEAGPDATIKVDQWTRALAGSEAREGGQFSEALAMREEPGWGAFARETFGSLYGLGTEEVKPEERPEGAEWLGELRAQAESLPEWKQLQQRAGGDAWASGIAAAAAMEVIAPTLPELPKEDPQELEEQLKFIGDLGRDAGATSPKHLRATADLKRRIAEARAQAASAAQQIRARAATVRSALRGAAQEAEAVIQEIADAMGGLGVGMGQGFGAGGAARITAPRAEVVARLRSDERIRRIAKLAGRLRAQAIAKQMTKAKKYPDEIADVGQGAELSRLLPSELALLGDEDHELLLLQRITERSALQYELRGRETRVEGPIILLIDESGSMSGANDEWAKGVALALCEIAARQKRPFAVVHFDTQVSRIDRFDDPTRLDFNAVLDMATWFTGGGTDLAEALRAGLEIIREAREKNEKIKRSDLVLISDGVDYDFEAQAAILDECKEEGVATYGIGISCAFPEELSSRMTNVVHFDTNELNGANGKLDEVFSI